MNKEIIWDFMKVFAGLAVSAVAPALKDSWAKLSQRPLGRTGVNVSILGLGGVGFLTEWNDKDAIAQLINEAIDAGINHFDTAHMYGEGKSEESLGLVMGTPRRKEIFLATKTLNRTYDGVMKDIETRSITVQIASLHSQPSV
ncbi:MAG: aldo/keto reductase [Deltaproteobacteria bacterium]|nr:aldo/keto reductase [Deltaproteobacteria bacterium]